MYIIEHYKHYKGYPKAIKESEIFINNTCNISPYYSKKCFLGVKIFKRDALNIIKDVKYLRLLSF